MKITIERGKKKYELLVGKKDCNPSKCAFAKKTKLGEEHGCEARCDLPKWYNDLVNKFSWGLVYPREVK